MAHEVGHASGALNKYSGDAAEPGSLMNPAANQAEPGTTMESWVTVEALAIGIRDFSEEDAHYLQEALNDNP